MIWTRLDPTTEAFEVRKRDAAGRIVVVGCLVRSVHSNATTIASAPAWVPGVSIADLTRGGTP